MEYDSVLNQQSISGKIVSLVLCVWKLGFFKSGHMYFCKKLLCSNILIARSLPSLIEDCVGYLLWLPLLQGPSKDIMLIYDCAFVMAIFKCANPKDGAGGEGKDVK